MGKREEFEGKQQAVMYQHTHNQIFQERKNPHCTDGRNQCIQREARTAAGKWGARKPATP